MAWVESAALEGSEGRQEASAVQVTPEASEGLAVREARRAELVEREERVRHLDRHPEQVDRPQVPVLQEELGG